jgi:hypothetical protein
MCVGLIWKNFVSFASEWQTLIGSLVGAGAAVIGAILVENYKTKKEGQRTNKQFLQLVQREVVNSINATIGAKDAIEQFLDNLNRTIQKIEDRGDEQYSIDKTAFIKFSSNPLTKNVLSRTTNIGYVDTLIIQNYQMTNELHMIVDNLREQLEETYQDNKDLCLNKANLAQYQKKQYVSNLRNYETQLRYTLIEKNLPLLLRKLAMLRSAVWEIEKNGVKSWKEKFESKNEYFWQKKKPSIDKVKIKNEIDKFLLDLARDDLKNLEISAEFEDQPE